MQAYVEIVFDNSDNRLPFDKDEVHLRRVIGTKKDQYFLDTKMVTKTDVMNLLESAGFSRSNPYYIVKQGKINELATAADAYRLKLLREVAGTRVYDERLEESKSILKDTESKREKIDELLKYIEERLKTLEEEKEELKEYQKWDKMRRSLEYTIYDHELRDTRRKMDEVHEKRENFSAQSSELYDQQQKLTDEITSLQKRVRDLERKYSGFEEERNQLNVEQSETFQQKTYLELSIRDLKEEVDGERSNRRKAEEDLEKLKMVIAQKTSRLEEIGPKYSELLKAEQKATTDLAIAEQRRAELYNKQGWTEQFRSADERDQWIKKQISKLDRQINEKKDQIHKLRQELNQEEARLEQVEEKVADASKQLSEKREAIEHTKRQQNEMKQKRDALHAERSDLWREETALTGNIQNLKDELSHIDMGLRSMIGRSIISGIDSVNKVLDSFRERNIQQSVIDGYYGTMMENFKTERRFFTAVEVTAGSRLFYHIVENDKVGTKILEELNRQKLPGEVNFFPLNRLEARDVISDEEIERAIPMIKQIEYDEKFAVVMKHVFGKTLICRNLDVATEYSKNRHLDCVTLDGDQVSHRGAITGGWYDNQRTRLEYQYRRAQVHNQIIELEEKFRDQRSRLNEIENQINNAVSDMQKLETTLTKMRDSHERLQALTKTLRDERHVLIQGKEPKQRQLGHFESTLTMFTAQRERLEADLGTALLSQLTREEQDSLDVVTREMNTLKEKSKDYFNERSKLEMEKTKLENELQTNLLRKRDELQSKLQEITVEDRRHLLDAHQGELKVVNQRISEISRRLAELDQNLESYYDDKKALTHEVEQLQSKEREVTSKINEESKEMEKLASKQSMLSKKIDESSKKIRELGSLPADAFDKYQSYSMKQLFKKLEECNRELKKYENVNKKALDQFISFSEQKEKLVKRKEEVDRAHKSILELIEALDQRKFDAIQLTFKQVSKYFEEVFARLVAGGRAYLDMQIDDSDPRLPRVEQFTGVRIRVSFSGGDETREMQQLSGGQKSLVALALIFAIQKCDPAPFYLFDEIDAAMDPQYRKAVADMIHDLSQNAQFITTTFRPELLETADKFYGVRFRNKVSHIDCVTKEEAADFVEDDATHA